MGTDIVNDYEKQQEHYDNVMKSLIEASKEFQELTLQNKEKLAEQVLGMFGMTGMNNMFKNQRWGKWHLVKM
ncbi:MAG: hypothetical protein J6C19_04855 [Lachnospiraceae bacterium]|nr:hypothetical protein [Lachnospiraceae bacterium]